MTVWASKAPPTAAGSGATPLGASKKLADSLVALTYSGASIAVPLAVAAAWGARMNYRDGAAVAPTTLAAIGEHMKQGDG